MCMDIVQRPTRRIISTEQLYCDRECRQYTISHGLSKPCKSDPVTIDQLHHSDHIILIILILFASIPSVKKIFDLIKLINNRVPYFPNNARSSAVETIII